MDPDTVLTLAAAVIVPVIGVVLRATPRNRLAKRIGEYRDIAENARLRDETAKAVEVAMDEMIHALVEIDTRSLRRKLDPAAVIAIIFLTAPAIAGFVLALAWDSAWRYPVLVVTGVWALVWLITGLTQLYQEHEDTEAAK